jgi:hypothetical protein
MTEVVPDTLVLPGFAPIDEYSRWTGTETIRVEGGSTVVTARRYGETGVRSWPAIAVVEAGRIAVINWRETSGEIPRMLVLLGGDTEDFTTEWNLLRSVEAGHTAG